MEDNLKGNSNASKKTEEIAPTSTVKPITTNVTVKNSSVNKITKKFFAEDMKTVGGHVADSVIIPSLQKLLSDIVKGGIDWLIYGKSGSQPKTGVGTVSYGSYYRSSAAGTPVYSNAISTKPTVYSVNEIVFNDRGEAEETLLSLRESIQRYQMVSVADFYDLIGQRCNYTDQKYGWYNLDTAEVIRVRDGYSIRFPRVQPIE